MFRISRAIGSHIVWIYESSFFPGVINFCAEDWCCFLKACKQSISSGGKTSFMRETSGRAFSDQPAKIPEPFHPTWTMIQRSYSQTRAPIIYWFKFNSSEWKQDTRLQMWAGLRSACKILPRSSLRKFTQNPRHLSSCKLLLCASLFRTWSQYKS